MIILQFQEQRPVSGHYIFNYLLSLNIIHKSDTDRTRLIHGLYTAYIRVIYGVAMKEPLGYYKTTTCLP
jgi:hypothetical protein